MYTIRFEQAQQPEPPVIFQEPPSTPADQIAALTDFAGQVVTMNQVLLDKLTIAENTNEKLKTKIRKLKTEKVLLQNKITELSAPDAQYSELIRIIDTQKDIIKNQRRILEQLITKPSLPPLPGMELIEPPRKRRRNNTQIVTGTILSHPTQVENIPQNQLLLQ